MPKLYTNFLTNFSTKSNTAVLTAGGQTASRDYITVRQVEVGNSSGSSAGVGWGYRLPNTMWKAGQYTHSGTLYTDDTTDAQSTTASDFPISTLSTNNDGYMIQAQVPFNIVNLVIGTAQNGAGTAEYTYWNGSSFASLTTISTPTVTSTGTVNLMFLTPPDWTALAATDTPVTTSGLTTGNYAIRVRYTTAPVTTAGLLTSMNLVTIVDYLESCGDGGSSIKEYGDFKIPYRAPIVPICTTADGSNWVNIEYRQGG